MVNTPKYVLFLFHPLKSHPAPPWQRMVAPATRNDQSSRPPLVHTSSMESMPPPAIPESPSFIVSSSKVAPESRPEIPVKEPRLGPIRNAGFRPIGQTSSAVKRFFPGEDEDDAPEDRLPLPVTPNGPRTQFVPVSSGRRSSQEGTSHPHFRARDQNSIKSSPDRGGPSHPRQSNDSARTTENHEPLPIPFSPSSRHSSTSDDTESTQNDTRNVDRLHSNTSTKIQTVVDDSDPVSHSKGSRSELYTIISQVGEGTFGKVYKARNTVTKVHVALKRIRMATEKDGFPVTAMREIKLLQSLRHENVVRLYEMMVSNGELLSLQGAL
jgi:hypothetical protein